MEPNPIAIGDIVVLTIFSTWNSQRYLNVLHYQCKNLPMDTHYALCMNDLIAAVQSDAVTSIVPKLALCMGVDASITEVRAQRVYPTRDYYISDNTVIQGGGVDQCTAGNLSAVITKQSTHVGRGRSGSFHVPAIPESAYASGFITANYLQLLEPLAENIDVTQVSGAGGNDVWGPGMFNPNLGALANWSDIARVKIQDTVRVMRRRTVGVGI